MGIKPVVVAIVAQDGLETLAGIAASHWMLRICGGGGSSNDGVRCAADRHAAGMWCGGCCHSVHHGRWQS